MAEKLFAPLRADLIRLLNGDRTTAGLLTQICYWFDPGKDGKPRARLFRHGKRWVAKTREEWCDECSLSLKQYNRASKVLRDLGVIEIRQMRFAGLSVSHMNLNLLRLNELRKSGVPFGHTQVFPKGTRGCSLLAHPLTIDLVHKTTDSFGASATAKPEAGMDSAEILAKLKGTKKASQPLSGFWQSQVALITGKPQPILTLQAKAQIMRVGKALGAEKAREIVAWALENWTTFAAGAAASTGSKTWPTDPHPGFMLKHYQWVVGHLQSIAEQEAAPPSIPSHKKFVVEKKEEAMPTAEELAKLKEMYS